LRRNGLSPSERAIVGKAVAITVEDTWHIKSEVRSLRSCFLLIARPLPRQLEDGSATERTLG
jgi:hypothetical protein